MAFCFLDDYELLHLTTAHPEGWIRLARTGTQGSNAPMEPIWGFADDQQYLGFSSGHRPWLLSSNSVRVPEATAFSVQNTLRIDTVGHLWIQSPPTAPVQFHPDTAVAFGDYGRIAADTLAFHIKDTTTVAATTSNMLLQSPLIHITGTTTFTDPVVCATTLSVPILTVAKTLTVAEGGQLQAPTATVDALTVRGGLALPPGASLCAEGRITLGGAATPTSAVLEIPEGTDTITLRGTLELPSSNAALRLLSPTASLIHHGVLSLPTSSQTHSIAGALELNGRLTCLSAPAVFQRGAEIHQSCIVGQPHRPAEVIVYGSPHFSKALYAHDAAYFDKTVRFSAPIHFSPTANESRHTAALTVPKGSLVLQEGHLWINAPPETANTTEWKPYALYIGGDTHLNGTVRIARDFQAAAPAQFDGTVGIQGATTLRGGLAVAAGGITVAEGGLAVARGGLTVAEGGLVVATGGIQVAEGGLAVARGGIAVAEGGLTVAAGDIALPAGRLAVRDGVYTPQGHVETQSLSVQGGQLAFVDGRLTHRHRRYGLYEPIAKGARWFKCLTIPYRTGRQSFYAKLQGTFFTPQSSKSFQIEFGGTTGAPNVKRATTTGSLGTMETAVRVLVYQDTTTQDFHLYIELTYRAEVGFELDILVGAQADIFTWDTTPPNLSQLPWSVWWKPLESPNESSAASGSSTADTRVFMDKLGLGEKSPQYALDVRPDARFQSKLYQPFPADLLATMGLTEAAPGGYAALTDVLSWLIRKIGE